MHSLKFSIILLSLLSLTIITTAQEPTFLYYDCPNTTTFTRNSTYKSNLNLLLSSLSSNATLNNISNGFYNTSAGQGPDDVHGLFLCRGDVSTQVCRNCVTYATKDIVQRCPNNKIAIIWYDECFLRYSNRTIFSTMDQYIAVFMWNLGNITDQPERFNQVVAATMNETATQAASAPSGAKKFAVKEANFTGFQNVYSLVQCTPDLSSLDCKQCLQGAIARLPICCNRKQGGRVMFPSCNVRYEIYEFYNATAAAPMAPPPPPPVALLPPPPFPAPGSVTTPKGKVFLFDQKK